jgi:hypothetical protein
MTSRHHSALALAVAALLVAGIAVVTTAQPFTTLEGTIASATPTSATVTTERGQITVILTSKTRIIRRGPATIADIKVGSFLGVAAAKQPNGTLSAVSVSILDAVRTVARAGQFPMESGNVMTNATVTTVVVRKTGRTIKMDYEDKSAIIFIPDDVSIHRILPGRLQDLQTGQHVTMRGEADGGRITAASITIE